MDNKMCKNHSNTLFLISILLVINLFGISQETEKINQDTLKGVIFFSDGFDNDTIQFFSEQTLMFDNVFLNSNPYYGLTRKMIFITKNNSFLLVKELNKDEYQILDRFFLEGRQCVDGDDWFLFNIILNGVKYESGSLIDLKETKYIVIYRKWCNIFFNTFKFEPGFE